MPLTCQNGLACVFLGKDGGWIPYNPDIEIIKGIPFPPKTDSWNKTDTTLYVTIASFRYITITIAITINISLLLILLPFLLQR